MTKSDLLKYIDERLADPTTKGSVGLLMVRQYVSDNMEDMSSVQPTQKNDPNTLDALDCVSRQAAIDAFDKELSAEHNHNREMAVSFLGAKRIIEAVPSVQPQRWIPCSERLPEMFHDVLISTRWKTVDRAYRSFTCWLHNGMDCTNYENDEILAWMPLPEPWKGEEE